MPYFCCYTSIFGTLRFYLYKFGNSWVFSNGPPAKLYPRLISSSFQPFGTAPMWKKAGLSLNAIPICCKLHRTSPFFWTSLNIFGIYFFLEGVHNSCSDSLLTLTLYLFGIRWHAFVLTLLLYTNFPWYEFPWSCNGGGNGDVFRPRLFHGNGRAMFRLTG